jgi:hypothetical protein
VGEAANGRRAPPEQGEQQDVCWCRVVHRHCCTLSLCLFTLRMCNYGTFQRLLLSSDASICCGVLLLLTAVLP